jgi:hypothetical protein
MAKRNKQITLDEDIVYKLPKGDASSLINDLLSDYFAKIEGKSLKALKELLEEQTFNRKILNKEIKKTKQKISKIQEREAKILGIVKKNSKKASEMNENKLLIERFKQAFFSEKIDEKAYFGAYDERLKRFDVEKIKEVLGDNE